MDVIGNAAIVTGGASGLGLATAKALSAAGARVAILDLGAEKVATRAAEIGGLGIACDVTDEASIDAVFALLKEKWGKIDFFVHAIAFSDKDELSGRYVDTSRENFLKTLDISCFSFTDVARRASALMPDGG